MKIRYGFVSNSSSTSFCIYGKLVSNNEFTEEKKDKIEKIGLYTHYEQDGEGMYVGREFSTIKDNETGKEFKDSTLKLIQEIFPDIKELFCITEGWYDG